MSEPWPPPAQNPYAAGAPYGHVRPRSGNALSVVSLVFGILGCLLLPLGTAFVLSFVLGVPALVCGIIALVRAGQGAGGKGLAIAGTSLGGLALVGAVLLAAIATAQSRSLDDCIAKATTPEEQISCSLTR